MTIAETNIVDREDGHYTYDLFIKVDEMKERGIQFHFTIGTH
jgi:hypothetical protein